MQVKERFCQFIRLLTDSKPKGVTDEEWKVIRDEREAKKRKQAELERYAIEQLGMQRLSPSQVFYLETDDVVIG